MDLATAARALEARHRGANVRFSRVATDSRRLEGGELFVALRGERFDGHEFIAEAAARGAAAAMVSRSNGWTLPSVEVDDTTLGLGRLAAFWRNCFDIPMVAVTGSNGKTTVKQMIGAILTRGGTGVVTEGNLNNQIGVPLTLLRLREGDRFGVLELGMNHPGEIAYLTRLVRPTVAVITNAASAHLEGLGAVDRVARAKGEIFEGLGPGGVAVVNADDAFAALWRALAGTARCLTFGLDPGADVRAAPGRGGLSGISGVLKTPAGEITLRLPVAGRHNLANAAAAAAAAIAVGAGLAQIKAGLENVTAPRGRLQIRHGLNGATIIDDTYNANPGSLAVAIDLLSACPGDTILVLGDMAELGPAAARFHREAGERARGAGIGRLLAVGDLSRHAAVGFGSRASFLDTRDALLDVLRPLLAPDVTVLVKGSRRSQLETVVDALCGPSPDGRGGPAC